MLTFFIPSGNLVIARAGVVQVEMASSQVQAVPRFEDGPCEFDTATIGMVEGEDVVCGNLVVPEEYANPDGPTIQLAIAILRSKDPNPQPDPLVMLQGGPGGSTIDTYTQILPTSGRLPGNRDIVLFDQRGTLYSDPALTCPEFMELTIETLDQDLPDDVANQMSLDALQKCRARLESEGINLSAFDSLENARDVESLRQALGYEQINLYGVSYGTLLALHVMRDFPQGLRTVILDSVVPTQTNFVTGAPQTQNRAFEEVFEACRQDPKCDKAFPDLRTVFYDTVDQLNADPVHIQLADFETGQTYEALVDGDTVISTIFQMMYNTDLIPLVPQTIYDVRAGNWDFVERILSFIVFDRTMSYGMYYSVLCAEDADFRPEDVDLSNLPEQLADLEDGSAEYTIEACKIWNVEALDPQVDDPVVSDIPTLVLTGDYDPITPPDYARQAAETLSNSYLFVFPAGGHGEVASTECADDILLQFLDNPSQEPDTACIGSAGPEFSTPGNIVRLPILTKLLNLTDGTGWQAALYLLSFLFLSSALLVYPLAWLVRLLKKKPSAATATSQGEYTVAGEMASTDWGSMQSAQPKARKKPHLYHLGPWLAGLAAGALLVFTVAFIAIVINLVVSNDMRIMLGLPGSARLIFIFPPIAAVLVILMLMGALAGWANRSGSAWGKLYLTLLSFAGIACIAVLAMWGMLGALLS